MGTGQHGSDIFDANSGHCLAYWLDSSNVDHYHIHMIETCSCIALILMILVYLQCKKWNMKKFYSFTPTSIALEDNTVSNNHEHNQAPLLNTKFHQLYQTTGITHYNTYSKIYYK